MSKRPGLGRGLDALLAPADVDTNEGIAQISLDAISRNPFQPRRSFDQEELQELAASIAEHGVLQPLLLTRGDRPDHYILIAGERRLLAARKAGLKLVPAVVRDASQQDLIELALIENVQRSDLGPLETAEAYRQLSEDFNLSHEQIAARVGKSRVSVTNTLRLLKLPDAVRQALTDDEISEGHACALLALKTSQSQVAALQTITRLGLNVRQTEELVRNLSGEKTKLNLKTPPPPEVTDLEDRLSASLSTRVKLKAGRKGGSVVIYYYSDEELDSLIDKLTGE